MSEAEFYDEFATLLTTFAAARSLPVSFPGVHFNSPDEGTWLEATWIPNRPLNYGMSDDGPTLLQGFAQVSVCYRPGTGIVDGQQLAGEVVAAFGKGVRFGDARVYERPAISSAIEDPERIAVPVTILWRVFST